MGPLHTAVWPIAVKGAALDCTFNAGALGVRLLVGPFSRIAGGGGYPRELVRTAWAGGARAHASRDARPPPPPVPGDQDAESLEQRRTQLRVAPAVNRDGADGRVKAGAAAAPWRGRAAPSEGPPLRSPTARHCPPGRDRDLPVPTHPLVRCSLTWQCETLCGEAVTSYPEQLDTSALETTCRGRYNRTGVLDLPNTNRDDLFVWYGEPVYLDKLNRFFRLQVAPPPARGGRRGGGGGRWRVRKGAPMRRVAGGEAGHPPGGGGAVGHYVCPVPSGTWAGRKLLCGGGMAWAPGEGGGGGVPEMGFCAGPFVLCKDGCCHQRRRNTNFGPENFFHEKMFPHICLVKMISTTWGSF